MENLLHDNLNRNNVAPPRANIVQPMIMLPCKCKKPRRNLVVCIDGTSNKFGVKVCRIC